MSDTETTEAPELEETTDLAALEGSNAMPEVPADGAVEDAEPEGKDEDAEARGMPPSLSQRGAGFIARFEGCVLHVYNDPTRNATIGVGHLIHLGPINGGEPSEFRHGITRKRALELLMGDAGKAARAVRRLIKVPLGPLRWVGHFDSNRRTGRLVPRWRCHGPSWRCDRGPRTRSRYRLPGLIRRRKAEGALFSNGKYD